MPALCHVLLGAFILALAPLAASAQTPAVPTGLAKSCGVGGATANFSWTAVSGATHYWLRVDNTANNNAVCGWNCDTSDILLNNVTGTAKSVFISPNVPYTWWLHAVNAAGPSLERNGGSFNCASYAAPSCSISLAQTTIQQGQSTTISWTTTNTSSFYISGIGYVAASGSATIAPLSSITYDGVATGAGGTAYCSRPLTVTATPTAPPAPANLNASCSSSGTQATVSWTPSAGATWYALRIDDTTTTSCASPGVTGSGGSCIGGTDYTADLTGTSRTVTVTPGYPNRFWVHAVNSYGERVSGTYPFTCSAPTTPAPTCSLSASPSSIEPGQSSTLTWSSSNATSVSFSPSIGSSVLSGSRSVSPTVTTTYVGTFSGPGGTTQCSRTITVGAATPAPSCSITVDDNPITAGESTQLRWTSSNATTFHISTVGYVTANSAGSTSIAPASSITYSGTATGPGGERSCARGLTVNQPEQPPACAPSTAYSCNNSANFILRTDTAGDCTTSTSLHQFCSAPTFCVPGVSTCQLAVPAGTLTAQPRLVPSGTRSRLTWSADDVQSCTVTGGNGDVWSGTDGSEYSSPIEERVTYTLACDDIDADTVADDLLRSVEIQPLPSWRED